MRERPIIFSPEMIRAILAGRKTQTRRVCKLVGFDPTEYDGMYMWSSPEYVAEHKALGTVGIPIQYAWGATSAPRMPPCPYGGAGDRLWVREDWYQDPGARVWYRADNPFWEDNESPTEYWKSSIYMPRAYSRITLEIIGVRLERLQDISEDDCCYETGAPLKWAGVGPEPYRRDMRGVFAELWDRIHTTGQRWRDSPWVWVIEFKRLESEE